MTLIQLWSIYKYFETVLFFDFFEITSGLSSSYSFHPDDKKFQIKTSFIKYIDFISMDMLNIVRDK